MPAYPQSGIDSYVRPTLYRSIIRTGATAVAGSNNAANFISINYTLLPHIDEHRVRLHHTHKTLLVHLAAHIAHLPRAQECGSTHQNTKLENAHKTTARTNKKSSM